MAITIQTAARNAACDAIVDLVDGGAGAGTIELKSAASTVAGTSEVATLTFSDPAFGAASVGVATGNAIASDTNATGGTASDYTVFDSNNTAVWQGSVGTAGADLNMSSTTIGGGDTVSISSFTMTMPAS